MDIGLYFRVLWRFRILMAAGLLLATLLSLASLVRVSSHGLQYRKAESYVSYATLLVTQSGFPEGQLRPPASADPSKFTSDAILYSHLATSDPVRQLLLQQGPVEGTVEVAPVLDPINQEPLPMVSIAAFAPTPEKAVTLARRQSSALLAYIRSQQAGNGINSDNRVDVRVVRKAQQATLFKGRSFTLSIVVFLGVVFACSILAFVLENMRPRIRAVQAPVARHQSATSDAA